MLDPDDQYNPCFALWAPGGGCKWDLNGDGKVCQEDLGELLSGYGTIYNQQDLGGLLSEYNGGCGAPCN
jgi:hypothetical protein